MLGGRRSHLRPLRTRPRNGGAGCVPRPPVYRPMPPLSASRARRLPPPCGARKLRLACGALKPRIGRVTRSFLEFARPAAPPQPRWGIWTVIVRDTCFMDIVGRERQQCDFAPWSGTPIGPMLRNRLVRPRIGVSAPFVRPAVRAPERKEEEVGVTERQAHGSQPLRVRPGERPGSPVGKPPCAAERPGAKRGGTTDLSGA